MNISHVLEEVAKVGRKHRSPKHVFQVRHLPWQIQPFALAPVVPGESLQNALLQVNAITDPIKSPLVGWWLDHYIFYVKLTDLEDSAVENSSRFRSLLIDPAATMAGSAYYHATAWQPGYKAGTITSYDFASACTNIVTKHFFRDEDETLNPMIDGLPVARAQAPGRNNWMESLQKDTVENTPGVLTGASPDDPEVASAYQEAYDRMVQMGATTLTYQDWLRSFGIKGVEVKRPQRPELLRYSHAWQTPSGHYDTGAAAVVSQVKWQIQERADKKRFFKEPGFIFGCTVARPKVYLGKQNGAAVDSLMDTAFSWLPATLRDRPELGLRKFLATAGPLAGNTGGNDYWIDVRDLFMYGDQFIGGSGLGVSATDAGIVALPGSDANLSKQARLYATQTMIEGLFTSTGTAGTFPGRLVKQDGSLDLHLLTAESDPT